MRFSKIFAEDIESLISDKAVPWEKFRGGSVIITGATGLIGQGCAVVLGELNRLYNYNIRILAVGRNAQKGEELKTIQGVEFIRADIKERLEIKGGVDYIIHCAAVTKSSEMLSNPVGLIETDLTGIKNVLELAYKKSAKGFIYTSSMESYGILDLPEIRETDQGYIDLANPRNCYPMCKRMSEMLCNCFYSQYGLPVNIVRLSMTFGAGRDFSHDNRVWAQFARCALNGSPIVLHTSGESLSAVTYMADALRGMFLVLLAAPRGETYNIASTHMKIREMAERIGHKFGLEAVVHPPDDIGVRGYASEFKLPLNSDKIKTIGWNPKVTRIEDMFERVLADARQNSTISMGGD
ncbi:MAG: NAD(P)-dependent oxidoreductase [Clostridiales bacterium]|jgi:nucleoside-diphosphate-sugar epimerase|nr:NAD(P)-dependent oxidoreductase [Clostridiales bacterium]